MTKEPEFLLTVIPVCLTSFGRRPSAVCTAFCTSDAAISSDRPSENVHVIVDTPCELCDVT